MAAYHQVYDQVTCRLTANRSGSAPSPTVVNRICDYLYVAFGITCLDELFLVYVELPLCHHTFPYDSHTTRTDALFLVMLS